MEPIPQYAIKVIPPECAEAEIYEELHRLDPASPNHTLPCEVVRSDTEQPILIMPYLEKLTKKGSLPRGIVSLLDAFHQIVEVSCTCVPFALAQLTVSPDMWTGNRISARSEHRSYGE